MLLGATLSSAGCQDGYPLAATRCDRWCNLTRELECGQGGPAACVVQCEREASTITAACLPELDALQECLEIHRSEIHVSGFTCGRLTETTVLACKDEQLMLTQCDPKSSAFGGSSAK
jgi:hypothetical protein